ncbi:Pbi1p KNAG_0E02770 [Huiozyma naganishii CBS 8797]|uniref:Uncharacterized protein n=1 Tax=Huiozyma naganishii (strain ATCC MYA-139 / BCRC 22969 / CBS 8797 / KCTC 17520 / NBRC 10181 / NCYC 3082 / Yp74L-3) TaxID=1071383 RepID=J7S7W5_HUIN7|nr:hypothetical protein KNAG_0E02770 [Kazachstania naganishii CBS 8797]CCK70536.1 hypothetical protein KNAG_0E02770 [Kazachstania naganishii CBS 8797]
MSSVRALSSFEKKLLLQSVDGLKNGTTFGAEYSTFKEGWSDEEATLLTVKDSRLCLGLLTKALENLIKKHIELFLTINEQFEFEVLKKIKTSDVISTIQFDSFKDEKINCQLGAPPYLLRHIFNHDRFVPGSGKPLWKLYLLDDSLAFFHGQDCLFDVFSTANFHRLLLKEVNLLSSRPQKWKKLDYVFKFGPDSMSEVKQLPKSIYDNPKLYIPTLNPDLFNLQTQSFFKSIYVNTVKKPIEFLTNTDVSFLSLNSNMKYNDILDINSKLCGNTVFGCVSNERFKYLNTIINQEGLCLKSFIVGIAMLCLKPMVKNLSGTVTFSIPVDLRSFVDEPRDFGLYYKDIRVECPLSLIDDDKSKDCMKGASVSEEDFDEKLMEYQFKNITGFVRNHLEQRLTRFSKTGFNDDDIRRMKFDDKNTLGGSSNNGTFIQIYDTSLINVNEFGEPNSFMIRACNLTKSLNSEELMSLSYTYCEENGLNICIHYPENYKMESFVECFQSFLEEGN